MNQSKKFRFAVLLLSVLAATSLVLGCSGGDDNEEDTVTKAAWILISPPGDLGWSYQHNQGRLQVEAQLDNVETTYIENVPENDADLTAVIDDLITQDYDIIFTTSFGYMDGTESASSSHPDAFFEHCSGYKTGTNMAAYFGRIYQSRYLTGILAGEMTTTNHIGYVAAFPIPEVVRGINAFTLGVRSVNPDAQVHVAWTFTWYGPDDERAAAVDLLDNADCDVMSQHQDSTAAVLAAQERGAYALGYDSDMLGFATDTVLTSAVFNWGTYYVERVKAVQDGTWTSHNYWGSMADGLVGLGAYGDMVDQNLRDEVDGAMAQIIDGSLKVFAGEVRKQGGDIWVASGQSMSDEDLLGMMEFVEGVVGDIPSD